MRSYIVMAMFVATLAHAGWGEYEDVRTLSLKGDDVTSLSIDAGAGSMDVTGVDGSGSLSVKHVAGSVMIDDGSGGIRVSDIEENLTIVNDGSGGLSISDVRGDVRQET